ncbi:MAG: NYN domain-containing protein [Nitrospiraceae bacterium]|nr:MAG: NYN domain-containing protein [Nitrospiraceae bacterium]
MSFLLIDGYNLIGTFHKNLSGAREKLLFQLHEYKKIKGHDITVVFDGWKSGGQHEKSFITGGITVIYSRIGETADAVIKRIMSRRNRKWIVISSDRDIRTACWTSGSVPVSADEFLSALERAETSFRGEYERLEDSDHPVRQKGNPKKLSKKEKTIIRALQRL